MAGKIKVSKNGKLFFSHVVTKGRVQIAFARHIGIPAGKCVAGAVHKGMGIGEIHDAVRNCTKSYKGQKIL